MKWGSIKLLALLLSLMLNAGILMLGLSFYQAQELTLSQSAGSQTPVMDFTLEIVVSESSAHKALNREVVMRQDDEETHAVENDVIKNDERESSGPIFTVDKKHDQADFLRMNIPVLDRIAPANLTEINERLVNEDSLAVNRQQVIHKPLVESRKQENYPQKDPKFKAESEKSVNLQARSGDQFATELAAKIHAQIEGCYPESSKRRGEEGVVQLMITKDPQKLSVMMIKSSGFNRLDRCAISAVEKLLSTLNIQEVPAAGIHLKPIRFQLR